MPEKVVITGMGTINSLGHSVPETWANIVQGVSGVGPITLFDASDLLVQIACEIKNYQPENHMSAKDARRRDRFEQLATTAAAEALAQSGLEINPTNADRVSAIVSASIGGIDTLQTTIRTTFEESARRISPFAIPMLMPNGAASMLSLDHCIKGPCFSVASACASGADGIGMAWMMIRSGLIDAALAGASEATITTVGVGAFDRLGAMSRRSDDFFMTPQPFDLNRDGLVMGEGAAILVLESERTARERGAIILAELASYASTADAYHITAPSSDGAGGALAMSNALMLAALNLDQVDYINAHGTATRLNDLSETRAVKTVFGDLAYNIPISSTKSMTGHMMGASGALEVILCVKTIADGIIPPTINYQTPDPACDLDYVPNQARSGAIQVAMSNAFGFGGHNSVLVIRAYR